MFRPGELIAFDEDGWDDLRNWELIVHVRPDPHGDARRVVECRNLDDPQVRWAYYLDPRAYHRDSRGVWRQNRPGEPIPLATGVG